MLFLAQSVDLLARTVRLALSASFAGAERRLRTSPSVMLQSSLPEVAVMAAPATKTWGLLSASRVPRLPTAAPSALAGLAFSAARSSWISSVIFFFYVRRESRRGAGICCGEGVVDAAVTTGAVGGEDHSRACREFRHVNIRILRRCYEGCLESGSDHVIRQPVGGGGINGIGVGSKRRSSRTRASHPSPMRRVRERARDL